MTTKVLCRFLTPEGEPLINAEAVFQLSKSGFSEDQTGIVMPRPITVITDGNGEVDIDLWPSRQIYHVTVDDPQHDVALHYKFLVPEGTENGPPVRLQDIVVDGTLSNTDWDTAAILVIQDAKAAAITAQLAAQAAAQTAATSAAMIGGSINDALQAAQAAQVARDIAQSAAVDADGSRAAAEGVMTLAQSAQTLIINAQTDVLAAMEVVRALTPYYGPTPPANPVPNAQWIDSTDGARYSWILDEDSGQWVEMGSINFDVTLPEGEENPAPIVTRESLGISNVDNTSDINKPISIATQGALNLKANADQLTALANVVGGITKISLGLDAVNNTADVDKPVSTPQKLAMSQLTSHVVVNNTTVINDYVGGAIRMNSNTTAVIVIPENAVVSIPVDSVVIVEQYGVGVVSFSPSPGVTLRSRGGATTLSGQYASAVLHKIGINEWLLMGDLA